MPAAALLASIPLLASAGGTAFSCRFVSLTDQGDGRYLLTLQAIEDPDTPVTYLGDRQLILHLQHLDADPLPSGNPPVPRAAFQSAIAKIRTDLQAQRQTRFGILGAALIAIEGEPGHYRVYGLRLEDERYPNAPDPEWVVYAE